MNDLVERYRRQIEVALKYANDEKPAHDRILPSVFELQVGHLRDIGNELAAELSRLSALVAWHDIETAPKTGVFLVYAPDRKDGRKPYVGGSNFAVMVRHENVTLVGGNFAFDVPSPTHWQSILAPPVSQLKDTTNADK